MFEQFAASQGTRVPRWMFLGLGGLGSAHVAALAAVIVLQAWHVDWLSRPQNQLAIAAAIPAPSDTPAAGRNTVPDRRAGGGTGRQVHAQPQSIAGTGPEGLEGAGHGEPSMVGGAGGGGGPGDLLAPIPGGSCVGPLCDFCTGDACKPTVQRNSEADAPVEVSISVLRRLQGDPRIPPPESVRHMMVQASSETIETRLRICISATGAVNSVAVLVSSGYPEYDAALRQAISHWVYEPVRVGDDSVPACTLLTLLYRQTH